MMTTTTMKETVTENNGILRSHYYYYYCGAMTMTTVIAAVDPLPLPLPLRGDHHVVSAVIAVTAVKECRHQKCPHSDCFVVAEHSNCCDCRIPIDPVDGHTNWD